jgi:predicted nucleotidyltransferase
MSHLENLTRIKVVYDALEELGDQVIFVGGATVSLYGDKVSAEIRPTNDVDILIELIDYNGYAGIEEKLRNKGFVNDWESGVICRYKVQGIIVDVMPTSEKILGFANRWYKDGYSKAHQYKIDNKYTVKIFSPEYFLAAKLEAFNDRGNGDGRMSTDFEDIVYILNNRTAIWKELTASEKNLKQYMQEEFIKLLDQKYIGEWISAHLEYVEKEREYFIIGSMQEFVDMI